MRKKLKTFVDNINYSKLFKCFEIIYNFILQHKVMAIDTQVSNWLMKYIHKHEIKLRT